MGSCQSLKTNEGHNGCSASVNNLRELAARQQFNLVSKQKEPRWQNMSFGVALKA